MDEENLCCNSMLHKKKKVLTFSLFLLTLLVIGLVNSIFMEFGESSWYQSLQLPSFTPPDAVFLFFWTFLYILLAFAGSILYLAEKSMGRTLALCFFTLQLILNLLWPFLFFCMKNPLFAAYEMIFLWLFTMLCMLYSYKIKPLAGWLLIPYGLWLTFAGFFNFSILFLGQKTSY